MENYAESLVGKTRSILKTQGYDRQCIPLEDVAAAIGDTHNNISRKVLAYKWSAMGLLLLIPIISTALSLVVTEHGWAAVVKPCSYVLTFLTLLNSILKPGDRFKRVCKLGIGIEQLSDEFLVKLDRLQQPVEERRLDEITDKFIGELTPYKEQLIDLFLPESPAEPAGKTALPAGQTTSAAPEEELKKSAHA
jgi:hypothetical protein